MSINFPNAPTVGQSFTGAGVTTSRWNGIAWDATGTSGGGGNPLVPTQDTPPATPLDGQLWWNSASGILFLWYDDGDSGQWVQALPTIKGDTGPPGTPAVKTALPRNAVVNGAMAVSQENGSTAINTNGGYPVDQWKLSFNGVSAAAIRAAGGGAYVYAQSISVLKSSLAAGDFCQNMTTIEGTRITEFGWGAANTARPAVLRFDAYAQVPGKYSVAITSAGGDVSFVKSFNLTGSLQTFVIPIPAQPLGTWPIDSSAALTIRFISVCGSDFVGVEGWQSGTKLGVSGQVNLAATINQNIVFSNVGLYLDPEATGNAPAWQVPNFADDLRDCMRYWEALNFNDLFLMSRVTSGQMSAMWYFMERKRVTPAVALTHNGTGISAYSPQVNGVEFLAGTYQTAGISSAVANARM